MPTEGESQDISNDNSPQSSHDPADLVAMEDLLTSLDPDVFDGISPNKKADILKSVSIATISLRSHSGPIPEPETLAKYDTIITNGADRIMKMAENQQNHRIEIEKKMIYSQSGQSKLGQVFGLVIGLMGIGCGTYLASIGQTTVGGIIAGGTVVSLVSVFVIGRRQQQKDLKED